MSVYRIADSPNNPVYTDLEKELHYSFMKLLMSFASVTQMAYTSQCNGGRPSIDWVRLNTTLHGLWQQSLSNIHLGDTSVQFRLNELYFHSCARDIFHPLAKGLATPTFPIIGYTRTAPRTTSTRLLAKLPVSPDSVYDAVFGSDTPVTDIEVLDMTSDDDPLWCQGMTSTENTDELGNFV